MKAWPTVRMLACGAAGAVVVYGIRRAGGDPWVQVLAGMLVGGGFLVIAQGLAAGRSLDRILDDAEVASERRALDALRPSPDDVLPGAKRSERPQVNAFDDVVHLLRLRRRQRSAEERARQGRHRAGAKR